MSDRPPATMRSHQQNAASRVGGYFAPLEPARRMLLTTFDADGMAVSAAVPGFADGDRAYFRAWRHSATARNLRHTDEVQVAPCAALGFVRLAPPLDAVARLLPGEEASRVAGKLARKYPVRQRFLIPLLHRTRRWQLAHYELVTYEAAASVADDRGASAVPDRPVSNPRGKEPELPPVTVVTSSGRLPWP